MPYDTLFSGKWIDVRREGSREYMVRTRGTGSVILIAVTDRQEMVLVEQYRVAVGARVIELPAGIVGDEETQEAAADAAARELTEETGYRAARIREVGQGPVSSGLTDEVMTFFYCDGLQKVGEGGGVEDEDIQVHVVPLAQIESFIADSQACGLLVDAKLYAGLYFAAREKQALFH